ncbi:hypothetical protein WN55_06067 [Dufourea novaeangliae]|uniref:Uncharacterized protein n=1 Tax=Dufourea novaeangliae TaxID=178035 RepID=A0A154P3G9_DUFNO|nr:hypothetical protein WN55_06067 [Dufourea novaeangliae]
MKGAASGRRGHSGHDDANWKPTTAIDMSAFFKHESAKHEGSLKTRGLGGRLEWIIVNTCGVDTRSDGMGPGRVS